MWAVLGFGVAGAGLGGWGWRAPRRLRFHITYLAGVGVLVLDYVHVRLLQHHLVTRGHFTVESDHSFVFGDVLLPVSTAILALIVGLVLYLTALILDRPQ